MFKKLYPEKLVSDITQQICSDFIFRDGTSPRNQVNDRLAVSNFFAWAVRREYAAVNPMQKVDCPEVDDTEPQILALADCPRLLASARDKDGLLLPYVALGLFAGLRPAELSRLTWSKIDLADNTVTIDGGMAKTRKRRIVKLSENAVAWLNPYAVERPSFTSANFQRHFARFKNAAGFNGKEGEKGLRPWVPDYMRHTAISHHFCPPQARRRNGELGRHRQLAGTQPGGTVVALPHGRV
jgi:integrase/recombinase XerD